MEIWKTIGGLTAAACVTAWATAPAPSIAVQRTDLPQLAGERVGEYVDTSNRREGFPVLRLEADSDSAWGQA